MLRGLKLLFTLLPVGIMIGVVVIVVLWSQHPERFPLRVIELRNEVKKIDPEVISDMLKGYVKQGFFGLDVEAIQKKLFDLPWVAEVSVRRVWPNKLAIFIQEQIAQALWEDNGVLSTEGIIFYPEPASLPQGLPRFRGPSDRAKEMLQQYFVLLEMLAPLGLTISDLTVSTEGVWRISLDNGIEIILGKTALNDRMHRFILSYSGIQQKMKSIAYLDLRYTNGIAIGWKKGGHPIDAQEKKEDIQ